MNKVTAEQVKELLDYDPETGQLYWRMDRPGGVKKGDIAGSLHKKRYIYVSVYNKLYYAHRLIWLWMTGEWPTQQLDHRDCDFSNNKWANLREATAAQNRWNQKKRSNNKSGVKGVYWYKQGRQWRTSIKVADKRYFLGGFDTLENAAAAYQAAALKHHGEFARTGDSQCPISA